MNNNPISFIDPDGRWDGNGLDIYVDGVKMNDSRLLDLYMKSTHLDIDFYAGRTGMKGFSGGDITLRGGQLTKRYYEVIKRKGDDVDKWTEMPDGQQYHMVLSATEVLEERHMLVDGPVYAFNDPGGKYSGLPINDQIDYYIYDGVRSIGDYSLERSMERGMGKVVIPAGHFITRSLPISNFYTLISGKDVLNNEESSRALAGVGLFFHFATVKWFIKSGQAFTTGTRITKNSVIEEYKVSHHAWRKSGIGRGATEELVRDVIRGAKKAKTVVKESVVCKFFENQIIIYKHKVVKVVVDETRKLILGINPAKDLNSNKTKL